MTASILAVCLGNQNSTGNYLFGKLILTILHYLVVHLYLLNPHKITQLEHLRPILEDGKLLALLDYCNFLTNILMFYSNK